MKRIFLVFLIILSGTLSATHIVGGDITVKHIAGNTFEVTMHIYRDCLNGQVGFENPSTVGLYDLITHDSMNAFDMPLISATVLNLVDSCRPLANLCVEDGLFVMNVTLPNNPNGYYLSWQRCCRNSIINNIVAPNNAGIVIYCEIPDPAIGNSTPVFAKPYPVPVMCSTLPNDDDFAASDSDGDSLYFSIITPLNGNSTANLPVPPPSPGPYSNVTFQAPYSPADMIGGAPVMFINSSTGMLTSNPNTIGVYVFAVRVEEFRNGIKIGEIRREMQYKVVSCLAPTVPTNTAFACANQQLTASPGAATYTWTDTLTGGTVGIVGAANTQTITVDQSGTYQVVMAAVAGSTCTTSALITVVVDPVPFANFTNTTVCVGTATQFTDISTPTGSINTWSWDFNNDGISDDATQNPSYSFITAGTYPVTLIVSRGPCTDTVTLNVTVHPVSTTSAGPDQTICASNTITLVGSYTGAATIGTWTGGTGTYNPNNTTNSAVYTPSPAEVIAGTVTLIYTTDAPVSPCVDNIDSMTITIYPVATANAGPPQTICAGSSHTLAGQLGGAATSGTWGGGTGTFSPNNNSLTALYTPSATEIAAGSVTLTLISNDPVGPCPAAISTVTITINPIPLINAGIDQIICIGSTVNLAGSYSGSATSGTWSGGLGTYSPNNTTANAIYTPTAAEETAGVVTLTFTSDNPAGPCNAVSDQMSITITQLPTANAGITQSVCAGPPITLAGTIGGSATIGTWSGGAGSYNPNNTTLNAIYTPSATELAAGSVTLTLTTNDPAGPCNPTNSAVVFNFYANPIVNFTVDVPKGCPIHCVNFNGASSVTAPSTITGWNWNFGDVASGSTNNAITQNPSHCYNNTGYYDVSLTVTTNNGCTASFSIPQMIQVYAKPVAEFDATPNPVSSLNPTITFTNQSSADVTYWNWNFGDGTTHPDNITADPTHLYPGTMDASYMVTLIVHNADGCKDTTLHPVIVGPEFTFFIPNAFTPNYDGINDDFNGSGIGIAAYDIWIYDRWGNMIFHTDRPYPLDAWDGKANYGSEIAQQDVYVWKVKLKDVFGKTHRYLGTVTLVK